jgi:hypothetical protein
MKHQILVTAVAGLAEQLIAHSSTDVDNTVIEEIKSGLDEIDTEAEPDDEKLIDAVFGVLEILADLTPTNIDNAVLKIAQSVLGDRIPDGKIRRKWKDWRKARKARKAAKRGGD